MVAVPIRPAKRKPRIWTNLRKNWQYLALCIPSMAFTLLFHYIPIFGIILPFKRYRYVDGIFGSQWVGLRNFKMFFNTPDFPLLLRNTLLYSVWFLALGMFTNVVLAILLYELRSRALKKVYQTAMEIPDFISMVMVGYITYAVLNPSAGLLNQMLLSLGLDKVDVYANAAYWPFILTVVQRWCGLQGYLIYYATMMGIDPAIIEAAQIDGANRGQIRRYIMLPSLVPLITLMLIMSVSGLFSGNFGLHYQIPRDIGVLYSTTDIIDTYIFRGLMSGSFTMSSAVGLMQSAIGLVLVVGTNAIVRKVSPDNSLF